MPQTFIYDYASIDATQKYDREPKGKLVITVEGDYLNERPDTENRVTNDNCVIEKPDAQDRDTHDYLVSDESFFTSQEILFDILFNKNAFFSDLCDSHNMRRTHSRFCTHMQICHKVVGKMRADTIFQLYACFELPILPKKAVE